MKNSCFKIFFCQDTQIVIHILILGLQRVVLHDSQYKLILISLILDLGGTPNFKASYSSASPYKAVIPLGHCSSD